MLFHKILSDHDLFVNFTGFSVVWREWGASDSLCGAFCDFDHFGIKRCRGSLAGEMVFSNFSTVPDICIHIVDINRHAIHSDFIRIIQIFSEI